jgi:uncharacterized protein
MTEPTKASDQDPADPSMEEILASIRRILNEDETAPPPETPRAEPPRAEAPRPETPRPEASVAEARRPEPAPAGTAPAEDDDDILVLDRSMLVSTPEDEPAAPRAEPPAPPPPVAFDPPPPDAFAVPPPDAMPMREAALLAPEAAAAAASSVDGLLRTLAASRSTQVHRGGPTIEDLVREEMRPLLQDWLNQHLPGLVERLVRAEIERVVGRAVS